MPEPIILSKTFAPLRQQAPTLAPVGDGKPAYERLPRISRFSWLAANLGSAMDGAAVQVTVGQPAIVSILDFGNVTGPGTAPEGTILELYWRPLGIGDEDTPTGSRGGEYKRERFRGPFAYLPRAGEYEIVAWYRTEMTGFAGQLNAELIEGVSPEEWKALVSSEGCAYVRCQEFTLGAGASSYVSPETINAFVRYRSLCITNEGANPMVVNMGYASPGGGNGGSFTIGAGLFLEIPPERLGRHSIAVTSAAGTDVALQLGMW